MLFTEAVGSSPDIKSDEMCNEHFSPLPRKQGLKSLLLSNKALSRYSLRLDTQLIAD